MKKIILVLICVFTFSIFLIRFNCKNVDNNTTINVNYFNKQNVNGMGLDYNIKNISKGKYKINLYSKEFKKGKFIKEESLYSTILNIKDNKNGFDISIYQENEEFKISIGESTYYEVSSDFFKSRYSGIALFGIESENKVTFNKDFPIQGYIIGDNVKNIDDTNIDDIFNHNSDNEIIIYLNISNIE